MPALFRLVNRPQLAALHPDKTAARGGDNQPDVSYRPDMAKHVFEQETARDAVAELVDDRVYETIRNRRSCGHLHFCRSLRIVDHDGDRDGRGGDFDEQECGEHLQAERPPGPE
jgi:hypothetical protein